MDDLVYVHTGLRRCLSVDSLISFHYYEFASNFYGVEESHDFWEMVYVDGGRIDCHAGPRRLALMQGQAVFHPPGEPHNIRAISANGSVCVIAFSCAQLDPAMFAGKVIPFSSAESDIIRLIYQEGQALFAPPYNILRQGQLFKRLDAPFGAEQMLRNHMETLLLHVVRAQIASGENARAQAVRPNGIAQRSHNNEKLITENVIALLRANIFGRLTMKEISRYCAFSESYIRSAFKANTGMSVISYYNKLKIDCAKQMVGEGKYTYTQISAMIGFSSIHYFSRVFRSYVKMSPMEYEKSVKSTALL